MLHMAWLAYISWLAFDRSICCWKWVPTYSIESDRKNFYCILDLAQFKFNYFLLRHYEIFSLLEDPAPKLKISGNIVVGLFDNANVFFSYHTLARYLLYRPATISCVCTHYIRSSTVQIYVSVVVQQTHLSCTK